jgi:hypothetical protein
MMGRAEDLFERYVQGGEDAIDDAIQDNATCK